MLPRHGTIFSIDLESTGGCAPEYSMISLAIASFSPQSPAETSYIGAFSENLTELPWSGRDPGTMREFWQSHPNEWAAATSAPKDPGAAMRGCEQFIRKHQKPWLLVAWPTSFDFPMFLYYQYRFLGRPFMTHCLDMKTLASDRLGLQYSQTRSSRLPSSLLDEEIAMTEKALGKPNVPHLALDDAVRQGFRYRLLEKLDFRG